MILTSSGRSFTVHVIMQQSQPSGGGHAQTLAQEGAREAPVGTGVQENQAGMGVQDDQADASAPAEKPWHRLMGSMQSRQRRMLVASLGKKDRQEYFVARLKRDEERQEALAKPDVINLTCDDDAGGQAN